MALTTLKQRLVSATQSVRSVFDSEKFEQNQLRDRINSELAKWGVKSFGEAAYDLAKLTEAMAIQARQEQGIPVSQRFAVFVALYRLARPELRYDIGGYWNKPGDEVEIGPGGKSQEKDCSRFYAGKPVVIGTGNFRNGDYSQKTTWDDESGPYRAALFEIVGSNLPAVGEKKHGIYHQMFDGLGWFQGFQAVADNPVTTRRLVNILTTAVEAKALAYFTASPMERDVMEMQGLPRPEHWSRAKQYDKYQKIYMIRNDARGRPYVDELSVLLASPADVLIRKGMKAWLEQMQARSDRTGEKIRDKEAVNAR